MIDLAKCIIFHQPRFSWNKGISLPQLPFGVRSCGVVIIWANICESCNFPSFHLAQKKVFLQPEQLCQHRCDESDEGRKFQRSGDRRVWSLLMIENGHGLFFANKNQKVQGLCLEFLSAFFFLPHFLYLGVRIHGPGPGCCFFQASNEIWETAI